MYWVDMSSHQDRSLLVLRVLAALFALVAVVCMTVAIVGMVTGRPGDRAGLWSGRPRSCASSPPSC